MSGTGNNSIRNRNKSYESTSNGSRNPNRNSNSNGNNNVENFSFNPVSPNVGNGAPDLSAVGQFSVRHVQAAPLVPEVPPPLNPGHAFFINPDGTQTQFGPNDMPAGNPAGPFGGKRRKHRSKTKKCRTKKHARKHKSRRSRA